MHDDVDFLEMDDLPTITNGGLRVLEKMLQRSPHTRLLVIDTLARLRGSGDPKGGSNAMYQESNIMAEIESLVDDRPSLCVLIVHHSTASKSKISGTEAVRAVPRTIIHLDRPDPDAPEGTLAVSHNGAPGAKFSLRMTPKEGWVIADPEFEQRYRAAMQVARGEESSSDRWN